MAPRGDVVRQLVLSNPQVALPTIDGSPPLTHIFINKRPVLHGACSASGLPLDIKGSWVGTSWRFRRGTSDGDTRYNGLCDVMHFQGHGKDKILTSQGENKAPEPKAAKWHKCDSGPVTMH